MKNQIKILKSKKLVILLIVSFFYVGYIYGQDSLTINNLASEKQPIEIDFLSSYYTQDGNNSAVTGGEGTEALKDFANRIKIKVPLKKNKQLNINSGLSYFTSASSDNIDPKTISGASKNDIRVTVDAIVNKDVIKKDFSYFVRVGVAHEAHFASMNAGFGFSKEIPRWQGSFSISNQFFLDAWGQWYNLSKLYPSDYFGPDNLGNNNRYAFQTSFSYEQIFNQRLKGSISTEFIHQFGLLSIPFHRVYFADYVFVDLERLPNYKLRLPITARLNYAVNNWLFLRAYYRFYWDSFKLKAHTTSLGIPLKVNQFLTFYPQYRYHYQYGNQYFAPKSVHLTTEEFYTSDYDQSDFHSHYITLGMKWIPFRKNKRPKDNRLAFKAIELRGGYYTQGRGFSSWMLSGGLSWMVLRKDKDEQSSDLINN